MPPKVFHCCVSHCYRTNFLPHCTWNSTIPTEKTRINSLDSLCSSGRNGNFPQGIHRYVLRYVRAACFGYIRDSNSALCSISVLILFHLFKLTLAYYSYKHIWLSVNYMFINVSIKVETFCQ